MPFGREQVTQDPKMSIMVGNSESQAPHSRAVCDPENSVSVLGSVRFGIACNSLQLNATGSIVKSSCLQADAT